MIYDFSLATWIEKWRLKKLEKISFTFSIKQITLHSSYFILQCNMENIIVTMHHYYYCNIDQEYHSISIYMNMYIVYCIIYIVIWLLVASALQCVLMARWYLHLIIYNIQLWCWIVNLCSSFHAQTETRAAQERPAMCPYICDTSFFFYMYIMKYTIQYLSY